jgi:hypothetical protein
MGVLRLGAQKRRNAVMALGRDSIRERAALRFFNKFLVLAKSLTFIQQLKH